VVALARDRARRVRPRRVRAQAELPPERRGQPERGVVQPGVALVEFSADVPGEGKHGAGVELEGWTSGERREEGRVAVDVPLELAEADVVFPDRVGVGIEDPKGARQAGLTHDARGHHEGDQNLHGTWSSTPLP